MFNFKWVKGRQNETYEKLTIFSSEKLGVDLHLIRYNEGSFIRKHLDPVKEGYEHHRINIILRKAKKGGLFMAAKKKNLFPDLIDKRVIKFRPDQLYHGVSKLLEGDRLVLSIGWLKKAKK